MKRRPLATPLDSLVGKKINKVFMNEYFVKFETNDGNLLLEAEGDCCSDSYFHDFIGLKKLIENGSVVSVRALPLTQIHAKMESLLESYGYEIVTNNDIFGDQTSVLSFRNESNGYYGGWMNICSEDNFPSDIPEILDDVLEAEWSAGRVH